MTIFPAILDACVLFPYNLRDVLIRAAAKGLYQVYWSQEILNEMTGNLVKREKMDSPSAESLEAKLKELFPEAMVDVPDSLTSSMPNHEGDHHVLAAAIVSRSSVIVTTNIKHFPQEVLSPYFIEAQTPDTFLTHLFDLEPDVMLEVIESCGSERKNSISVDKFLQRLNRTVPNFVNQVSKVLAYL